MPDGLEKKLKGVSRKKKFGKEREGSYVYGTLRKTGWKPSQEKSKRRKSGRKGMFKE